MSESSETKKEEQPVKMNEQNKKKSALKSAKDSVNVSPQRLVCFSLAGKQFIAQEGQKLVVPKSHLGDCQSLGDGAFKSKKILAVLEDNNLHVGKPYLDRELVFKLEGEFKGKKIIVFKKKKRKGYQKKIGFRPLNQVIQIVSF